MERSYDDTASLPTPSGIVAIPPVPFGKYTLVARIGRGGMADILLAIAAGPSGFRKLVVIKRLRDAYEDVKPLVEGFVDEARLGARLEHPNVVHTLDHGTIHRQHYMAMEFLEGQTFARVARRMTRDGREMPFPFLFQIAIDVLDALHYAHELCDFDGTPLGVVHRDVSPANVMITYHGTVKLLDFGVAKSGTQMSDTDPEVRKGKFAYLSPEQIEGTVDRRSDLFSLGVILWEAVAGKRLFFGSDPAQTIKRVTELPVPALSTVVERAVPKAFDAVVKKALHRDPARRFQSAADMREAIERIATDEEIALSRRAVAELMVGTFADLRDAHTNDIRRAVEAGLETATARFEVLTGIGAKVELVDDIEGVPPAPPPPPPPAKRKKARSDVTQELLDSDIVFAEDAAALGRGISRRTIAIGAGGAAVLVLLLVGLIVASAGGHEPEGASELAPPRATTPPSNEPRPRAHAPAPTPAPPAPELAPPPFDADAFDRLRAEARGHFAAGRFEEAAHAYEAATLMNPAHPGSFAGLGASRLELGEVEGGIAAYEEAVRLDPLHSGYRAALGRAYLAAGRTELAAHEYREALRLDENNGAARDALRELGEQP